VDSVARREWLDSFMIAHIKRHGSTVLPSEHGMITENGVLSRYFQRFLDREGLEGKVRLLRITVTGSYGETLVERIPYIDIRVKEVCSDDKAQQPSDGSGNLQP
jgi:hypothetical protein